MALIQIGTQDRVRASILSETNVLKESKLSGYIIDINNTGILNGFEVYDDNRIGEGEAWLATTDTDNIPRYIYIKNYKEISFTGTDGYIYINVPQSKIDLFNNNDEKGINIATIEASLEGFPSTNCIPLAIVEGGVVQDARTLSGTKGNLENNEIDSFSTSIEKIDNKIIDISGQDHLEEKAFMGERCTSSDALYKQLTPTLSDSTVVQNVGDVDGNKEIHIQRIGSGVASNKLKLKVKMGGSPTTNLVVEVRSGIKVNVSTKEAYWYGDSKKIIATGTKAYTDFSSNWTDVEFTLNNSFGLKEGELLDVVVYQENDGSAVIDNTNYYIIGCDSMQWGEAFRLISVNGTTRNRSRLMPYCISDGFVDALLCKVESGVYTVKFTANEGPALPIDFNQYFSETYGAPITSSSRKYGALIDFVATGTSTAYYSTRCYLYSYQAMNSDGSPVSVAGSSNDSNRQTFMKDFDLYKQSTTGNIYFQTQYRYESTGTYLYSSYQYVNGATMTVRFYRNNVDNLYLRGGIAEIGEKVAYTTFGRHTDGSFITEVSNIVVSDGTPTYSSSTFDITAWRGYLYIKIGGTKYTIPYTGRS